MYLRRNAARNIQADLVMCLRQRVIDIPPIIEGLVLDTAAEHGKMIVDECLLLSLYELWGNGIQTTFSCCGHEVWPPFIALAKTHNADMHRMFAERGLLK